jgi:FkbM family methyltransferase
MSICIFNENQINKLHSKYYNYPIKNKRGTTNVKYDKTYLEEIKLNGFCFIIHKNDTCIADTLRRGELFEKFIVTFVKHFINPTKNIIDLGANIGTHSIIYSNYTNGKIYSFEPQKVIFDILTKNIEANNCNNIIPFNFGASNENKKFYMNAEYGNKNNQGAFRIDNTLSNMNGLEIECKKIDDLNISNVSYIKIDVEGHEYEALLGMKNLLIREHPSIMIEIHDSCKTKNNTFKLLIDLGYNKYYKLTHCDYIFPKF